MFLAGFDPTVPRDQECVSFSCDRARSEASLCAASTKVRWPTSERFRGGLESQVLDKKIEHVQLSLGATDKNGARHGE
jgi:hypothetical protein